MRKETVKVTPLERNLPAALRSIPAWAGVQGCFLGTLSQMVEVAWGLRQRGRNLRVIPGIPNSVLAPASGKN